MSEMQLDVDVVQAPDRWSLDFFNSLYFIGLGLLAIVILPPLLSRNVSRGPLWFCFMGSWMLYCVSFLLIVGRQLGPEPPFGLCLFQAALIHAAPAFATLTGVCFIVDVYFALQLAMSPKSQWVPKRRTPFLLALPIVVFFVLFFLSLAIGLQNHSNVNREPNNMFCHINTGLPTLVSAILSGSSIFIAIGLEAAAVIVMYHNWATFPRYNASDPHIAPGMLIRISLFSLLTLLGLSLSAIMLFHVHESDVKWNILLPILPNIAAILFGTQRDILLGWRFWKHESKAAQAGAV
ncbi:hypothetical protein C8R44DRAFT_794053 [Mycena epipterygia]|nr:hypothetical protein C8R44DRAFT_794053 [Mycena epipterygia]